MRASIHSKLEDTCPDCHQPWSAQAFRCLNRGAPRARFRYSAHLTRRQYDLIDEFICDLSAYQFIRGTPRQDERLYRVVVKQARVLTAHIRELTKSGVAIRWRAVPDDRGIAIHFGVF